MCEAHLDMSASLVRSKLISSLTTLNYTFALEGIDFYLHNPQKAALDLTYMANFYYIKTPFLFDFLTSHCPSYTFDDNHKYSKLHNATIDYLLNDPLKNTYVWGIDNMELLKLCPSDLSAMNDRRDLMVKNAHDLAIHYKNLVVSMGSMHCLDYIHTYNDEDTDFYYVISPQRVYDFINEELQGNNAALSLDDYTSLVNIEQNVTMETIKPIINEALIMRIFLQNFTCFQDTSLLKPDFSLEHYAFIEDLLLQCSNISNDNWKTCIVSTADDIKNCIETFTESIISMH